MKETRYLLLVLLSSLLMWAGCSRRNVLDDYPVTGINIRLNWDKIDAPLPEGVRVIFYPKDDQGKKVDTYLPAKGGEVKVPPGHYSVVIYNHDSEVMKVEEDKNYETIIACPARYTGPEASEKEGMVWGPDAFYVASPDEVVIGREEELPTLEITPKPVVITYRFEIKAEGLKNVSSIIGSVSGMAECYRLGKRSGVCRQAPIYCETRIGDGVIKGTFTCFGPAKQVEARADISQYLDLIIVRVDGSKQAAQVEITEEVKLPEEEGGGSGEGGEGEGDDGGDEEPQVPTLEIEFELSEDEKIVVDDVKVPPSEGGGGIGGDVSDWDDETNVELPVS